MGKLLKTVEIHSVSEREFSPPFYIVRDHRRILKQRKQREIRKKKLMKEKEIVLEAAREEKMSRIKQINLSMLEGDDVWNMVNDDIKLDSEESFTHDIESGINKRIQQIRLEILFTLNNTSKESLYQNSFSPFQFNC
jgi:hypothetical protein